MADDLKQILDARTPKGWYGLATGKGWWPVIAEAHEQIVALFPDYEVHQIKEKFGGLRYYCSVQGDPRVRAIVAEAEEKCAHRCEACGAPAETTRSPMGWAATLCEVHERV